MVVIALQRFGSRSNSFYGRNAELHIFQQQLGGNMSEPVSLPRTKSEPLALDDAIDTETSHRGSSTDGANDGTPILEGLRTPSLSSSPGSPPFLSRNPSFLNSSSYQEDWEAFPPLDKLTVFDLLDNFALPQKLEKWQTALSAQSAMVRRQQEKIRATGLNAKDRVVGEWRKRVLSPDEQLDKYRRRMKQSVDRLGRRWSDTAAVTTREKVSFIAGVLNIFISGYLIGAQPAHFYLWFTAQLAYFMPIRFWTYHSKGYHYFLADLCYFVNLLAILSIWVAPRSKRLFISTYCLAYGNNAVAIAMWRNSMVFHSLDKITSLFIHIMPPVTLHCMVHLTPADFMKERFPAVYDIKFSAPDSPLHYSLWAMMIWATVPYAIWQISYHLFITVRRREKIAAGRPTSFTWLRKSYSKTMLGKFVLSLPQALQEPAFMMIQYAYALLTMLPCPIWFWFRWPSAGFLIAVFVWSIYNGATYYIDVFGKRFQNELEQLKKEVAKWQSSPEGATSPMMIGNAMSSPPTIPSDNSKSGIDSIPMLDSRQGSTGIDGAEGGDLSHHLPRERN